MIGHGSDKKRMLTKYFKEIKILLGHILFIFWRGVIGWAALNRTSSRNSHQIDFSKLVLGFLFSYTHLEALKKLRHHLAKCERCEPEAEKENDPPNDQNGQKKERANIDSSIWMGCNYFLAKNLVHLRTLGFKSGGITFVSSGLQMFITIGPVGVCSSSSSTFSNTYFAWE